MSGSGFTVKVKINSTNKILKDHGLDQDGRAIRFLRDDADRLMNPYIPMDNGIKVIQVITRLNILVHMLNINTMEN